MPKLISALVAGFLFTGSAALAGCGTQSLNTDKAESGIKSFIEQQTGARVSSVDCPGNVKAEKGKTFTCEATGADGTKATINVTQASDKGDVNIDAPLLHTGPTEQFIAESIRGQTGRRATVDCPDLVVAKKAGTRLTCRSSSGGKKKNIAVKVDAQGRITWNLGG
jgi:hypothetical protein